MAIDDETKQHVALKTPSTECKDNKQYLESFLMEDWIAKRINNPYVLKAYQPKRPLSYLYTVTEYIDGCTLTQWMQDNPHPPLNTVRNIVKQIGSGLQAFHRKEMIHQDLRPNNIMIDATGTVKIIDFGATQVAGINDIKPFNSGIVGTLQYSAPEYFLHQPIAPRADIFSLGVITFQMLSNQLPYGTTIAKATTETAQRKLTATPLNQWRSDIPLWVTDAIEKAITVNARKRYQTTYEFLFDLSHPNRAFVNKQKPPLIERKPVRFWQGVSSVLLLTVIVLLNALVGR